MDTDIAQSTCVKMRPSQVHRYRKVEKQRGRRFATCRSMLDALLVLLVEGGNTTCRLRKNWISSDVQKGRADVPEMRCSGFGSGSGSIPPSPRLSLSILIFSVPPLPQGLLLLQMISPIGAVVMR